MTKSFSTPSGAAVSFSDAENETALDVNITSSSGGTTILVNRYEDSPQDVSGVTGNVSQYRWIVQQMGLASSFSTSLRFNVSQIPMNGISDSNAVTIYSRSTPGRGAFSALITAYDSETGELVATEVQNFGEFVFGSSSNPLPVRTVSLTGSTSRSSARLTWKTENEMDNHGFEIERRTVSQSNDPGIWKTVGFVEGSRTTSSPREYSFVDQGLSTGRYAYRIKQIDLSGSFRYSEALELEIGVAPLELMLAQNYPNPFNPATTIEFTVPEDGRVRLQVYDLFGRAVATIFDQDARAGHYLKATFDASDLASGIYFARLQFGGTQLLKRMLLVK